MAKTLANMTAQELEDRNAILMQKKADIQDEQRELNGILGDKLAAERAERLAENLSDPEKAALAQLIEAEGISSDEAAGTPSSE